MSLLADLLSKNKTGSSNGGNESPLPLNVPPTLSKAQGNTAPVRTLNNRYVKLALILVVLFALGAFITVKLSLFGKKIPQTSPAIVVSPSVSAPQVALPQPATPQLEQINKARITLGEPTAVEPLKKKARAHKTINSQHTVQKAERPPLQAPAPTRQKTVVSRKIDTAMRDSLLYAARSAEQVSDWKSALANYRRAQDIDPDNYKIMSNVAAALNNLGMFDDGIHEAERALGKKPDYVPALINAAIGHSSKGHTQKALRLFTYASALDPSNRSLVINLGILHERAGNLDAAQATYRQLAAADDPLALQGMARIYERKGNRIEAVRAYRQIMALPNASSVLKREVKGKLVRLEE
jgi:Flp pilus assembly protein TadD